MVSPIIKYGKEGEVTKAKVLEASKRSRSGRRKEEKDLKQGPWEWI